MCGRIRIRRRAQSLQRMSCNKRSEAGCLRPARSPCRPSIRSSLALGDRSPAYLRCSRSIVRSCRRYSSYVYVCVVYVCASCAG